ncbi:MAG: hypothetical protein ACE5R4_15590 [Armatimonadota bacterium]
MVELRVFGKDINDAGYREALARAQEAAESFGDQVSVVGYDSTSEEAEELGIGRFPAVAVGRRLVAVATIPPVSRLTALLSAALEYGE